jgi:hypothetical protein
MRAFAAALAAILLGGCVAPKAHPPKAEGAEKRSYNRRELPPEQGLFSGPDGTFTVYRNDAERRRSQPPAPPAPPAPPKPTTLSCEPGFVCDPPAAPR